jgi:hypothetical protein
MYSRADFRLLTPAVKILLGICHCVNHTITMVKVEGLPTTHASQQHCQKKKKTLRNSVTISQSPPPLQPAQIKRNRSIANQKNTKKDICTMLVSQHRKTLTIEELSEILRCSSTGNRTLVSRDL